MPFFEKSMKSLEYFLHYSPPPICHSLFQYLTSLELDERDNGECKKVQETSELFENGPEPGFSIY